MVSDSSSRQIWAGSRLPLITQNLNSEQFVTHRLDPKQCAVYCSSLKTQAESSLLLIAQNLSSELIAAYR